MTNLDQWILVVVALAAVISPVLTAVINNRYQLKLEKIKLDQIDFNENTLYKRNVIHEYLASVSMCITYCDNESEKKYGEFFPKAYVLINDKETKKQMLVINQLIFNQKFDKLNVELEKLLPIIEKEYNRI